MLYWLTLIKLKRTCYMAKIEESNKTPIIITNNCWGYHYYQNNNIPYPTPFIGLFIFAPDYLEMLEDFEEHMSAPLKFTKKSKYHLKHKDYPIGKLLDVEIHFLHYKSEDEAKSKWERRKSRMHKNMDYYYFKFDDVEKPFEDDYLKRYNSLPFKNKISFTKERHPEYKDNLEFYFGKSLSGGRLYRTTPFYININKWLAGKGLSKHFHYKIYQKTLSHLFNR